MASVGLIRESGSNRYESNKKSQNLATSEAEKIMTHLYVAQSLSEAPPSLHSQYNFLFVPSFENCIPLFQEMPAFLRSTGYQDVTDAKATVFQSAHETDLDACTWFSQNPAHKVALTKYMDLEENMRGSWLDEYPFKQMTQGWDPRSPVFVDIGGHIGHCCVKFKQRFPNIPGRVILQYLPSTRAHAIHASGVEVLAHDFFEPQPVKGQ